VEQELLVLKKVINVLTVIKKSKEVVRIVLQENMLMLQD
jgi:hypothetical protein